MSEQYKKAGVDIEAGYEAVKQMKVHVQKTMRKEVLGGLGGFGAAFDLSELNMKHPILVSGTDGVGTKLALAIESDKHDTIGIDAVAMCVNDILTVGAEPLYFLDYIAVNKVIPEHVADIVKGVSEGCVQSNCALIGGETAEMGDMYKPGDYDIAGFAVGAVEKEEYIDFVNVKAGDKIIGLPSSGVHSNGFSLVRKVLADNNVDFNTDIEGKPLIERLLEPTKIYVKPVLELKKHVAIKSMSHITGGGFYENIPRALPEGLSAKIDLSTIDIPVVIDWLIETSNLSQEEAYNVFNMGIGYMIVVSEDEAEKAIDILKENGEEAVLIGEVVEGEGLELYGN